MPGLIELLNQITELWKTKREDLLLAGEKITEATEGSLFRHEEGQIAEAVLHQAYEYFQEVYDSEHGGFGQNPKFPTPHNLYFLLRYWKMTDKAEALEMVEKTLEAMYRGGIYDHIGFGFARYSTDNKWLIPHFEKMLYDNSLLAIAYLEAYQATHKELYAKVAKEIFTYVLRDMTSPEGAFYSAEDADSEGEEGKFYAWTPEEIVEVLGETPGKEYCQQYGITEDGNFEGKSIPNLIGSKKTDGFEVEGNKLFLSREDRVHPFKDDKVLTAWNGLMIAAMAFGGRVLGEEILTKSAERAMEFVLTKLQKEDGRLLTRYRDGDSSILGFLDDYAFLIWGLIELHQANFNEKHLTKALELNDELIRLFWDDRKGGLFQYGLDAEQLISRPKELYDGAIPSGNSVATVNFLRLAEITGSQELVDRAEQQFKTFGGTISEQPMAYTHFLIAVYLRNVHMKQVKLVGDINKKDMSLFLKELNASFKPEVVTTLKAEEGQATAYVCKNFTCLPPVTEIEELRSLVR